jgi:ankyrin repeat protein
MPPKKKRRQDVPAVDLDTAAKAGSLAACVDALHYGFTQEDVRSALVSAAGAKEGDRFLFDGGRCVKLLLVAVGVGAVGEEGIKWGQESMDQALMKGAMHGNNESVAALLDNGAKIEATDKDGATPLLCASTTGCTATAVMLLNSGANMEATDKDGATPLLCASWNGHAETSLLLLEKGANLEATNAYGTTPLLGASSIGHTETAMLLLEKGANLEATTKKGSTPLIWATIQGHTETAMMLLDKGANMEAATKKGNTSLMIACSEGHAELIELLLARGADHTAKNHVGQTAHDRCLPSLSPTLKANVQSGGWFGGIDEDTDEDKNENMECFNRKTVFNAMTDAFGKPPGFVGPPPFTIQPTSATPVDASTSFKRKTTTSIVGRVSVRTSNATSSSTSTPQRRKTAVVTVDGPPAAATAPTDPSTEVQAGCVLEHAPPRWPKCYPPPSLLLVLLVQLVLLLHPLPTVPPPLPTSPQTHWHSCQ